MAANIMRTYEIPNSQQVIETLRLEGAQTSEPDVFKVEADIGWLDSKISALQERIDENSCRITRQLPGVQFDDLDSGLLALRTLDALSDPLKVQFIFPRQILNMFHGLHRNAHHSAAFTTRGNGRGMEKVLSWQKNLMQRQLWRLQDLRDGGGLGFTVELFLLSLKQLLSTSPSQESRSALYIGTFRAITSDWGKYKHSLGTQKILLDAAASDQGIVRGFDYPAYIIDELWLLLDNVLEGQTGPHIDNAVQQLTDGQHLDTHRTKALTVISRLRERLSEIVSPGHELARTSSPSPTRPQSLPRSVMLSLAPQLNPELPNEGSAK